MRGHRQRRPKEVQDELVRGRRIVTIVDKWSGDRVTITFPNSGTGFSTDTTRAIRRDVSLVEQSRFVASKVIRRALEKAKKELELRK